jgi:Flp pilus assembly protein TadG
MKLHRNDQPRGQALVEFALVIPIFVLLLMGIFDLGRAVYAFNTISNAAREGVRVAIVNQNAAVIDTEAVNSAVSLGLTPADVDFVIREPDFATGGTGTCATTPDLGCVAEVTVRYRYTAATPIIGNLVGVINMTGQTRQPIERAYVSP